jgi:transglutaminase-like putative cysteine protease
VRIEAGYDIAFNCQQEVPLLLMLSVHPSREADLLTAHRMDFTPQIASRDYRDVFGNVCTRLVAPPGILEIRNHFIIRDSGKPDKCAPEALQRDIDSLPDDTLVYLLGSRYCDTEKLSDLAWSLFGSVQGGWRKVQAVCDHVHDRWISLRSLRSYGGGRTARANRCVPRFCPFGYCAFSQSEYPGEVLHGLPGRHRSSPRSGADGFQRGVRSFP